MWSLCNQCNELIKIYWLNIVNNLIFNVQSKSSTFSISNSIEANVTHHCNVATW